MDAIDAKQSDEPRKSPFGLAWERYRWRIVLLATLAFILLLASSTHVRIGLKSAGFLIEVFPDAPAYPVRWFSGEPHRTLVQFPHENVHYGAFLYHPAETGCHAGIVMYIGLGPEHGDDHLDRISRAFARNGIAVLIPVSGDMVEYRLSAEEHLVAASAFEFLQMRDQVNPERVGMFGISVGGSIVVNAAQEPRINDQVAMVHSLGGYYDATTLLANMSAGSFEVDGEFVDWEPSTTTFRATRNSILPLLPDEDRSALWRLFDPQVTDIPPDLTPEGEALARVLVNREPERIDSLVDALPEELIGFLDLISPSHGLENLTTTALLLHDKHDHVLPYGESLQFAADASEDHDLHLTVIEQFHHVRPDVDGDRWGLVGDGLKLYRHIFRMHRALDDRGWLTSPIDLIPFGSPSAC